MTLEALRGGRPAVLADLLERYGRDLNSVAYLILRDRAAAEDVVADTLLVALEQGSHLRDDAALRPWLLRIATNRALRSRTRGARIVQLHVVSELESRQRGPDADERAALWQAVTSLPPRMRAAIGLRYYLDLPVDTVANVLGVSPNTVKTQLKTALVHLREALRDERAALGEVRSTSPASVLRHSRFERIFRRTHHTSSIAPSVPRPVRALAPSPAQNRCA